MAGFVDAALPESAIDEFEELVEASNGQLSVDDSYKYRSLAHSFTGKMTPYGGSDMLVALFFIVPSETKELHIRCPEGEDYLLSISNDWIPHNQNSMRGHTSYKGSEFGRVSFTEKWSSREPTSVN